MACRASISAVLDVAFMFAFAWIRFSMNVVSTSFRFSFVVVTPTSLIAISCLKPSRVPNRSMISPYSPLIVTDTGISAISASGESVSLSRLSSLSSSGSIDFESFGTMASRLFPVCLDSTGSCSRKLSAPFLLNRSFLALSAFILNP